MRWWKKWEHEDHWRIQPSSFKAWLKSERHGSDSQLRTIGIFNRVDDNGGAVGFETWMNCCHWWGIDCETGKNGGVGLELLWLSRDKWWCWFQHAKELNGFGLVVQRAERSRWGWFLGNMGMMGMEAALSDQLKAGGSKVGAVAGAGAESVSWAWASALTRRGGGLVWDEEVWCEGENWLATSTEGGQASMKSTWTMASSLVVQVCPSGSPTSQERHVSGLSKHHCPWPSASHSSLSASIPMICPWSAPSQNACFTSLSLKSSIPLLNPSFNPSQNACFQMRPNSESGNDVARVMSFSMLSSVTGGGDDNAAVVVDVDAGAGRVWCDEETQRCVMWQQKVASSQSKAKIDSRKWEAGVLKHEAHSHHQVEQPEVLPQHIADWVDGGIAVYIEVFTLPRLIHMDSIWNPWNPSGIPCGMIMEWSWNG